MKNVLKAFAIVAGLAAAGLAVKEVGAYIVEKSSQCPDGGDVRECSIRLMEQKP